MQNSILSRALAFPSAVRSRANDIMLTSVVGQHQPVSKNQQRLRVAVFTALLTVGGSASAMADVLGVAPISTEVITGLKLLGLCAIGWGFFRMMNGRHQIEALISLAVGALGLGKTAAIAAFLGL